MIILLDKLKKFVDIAGINNDGFEIVVSAGIMSANVLNNDRNVVLVAEHSVKAGDEMKLRIQRDFFMKYLRNISSKEVLVESDDTMIKIEGGNLTLTFPQIVSRVTDGTKKVLPDTSNWKRQASVTISPSVIQDIISVTENIGEKIVTFTCTGGILTVKVKRTAVLKSVCSVECMDDIVVSFHIGAFKDALGGCKTNGAIINIFEETKQGRPPIVFLYNTDDIVVSGLMAEWREKE